MALAYRQTPAASQSGTTVTTFAVTKQTGTASGDWIFIFLFGTNATTIACTGFNVLLDANNYGCLLYRLADGTEPSSFSITGIGTVRVGAIIATVSGGATTLDAINTPTNSTSSTSLAVSSITLAKNNDWVLWFGANENGFSAASFTITPPSGFTSRAAITAQTNNPAMVLADNTTLPSGATGTKTGTCTSSSFWCGVMVGVAPAPVTISGTATLSGAGGMGTKPLTVAPGGTQLAGRGAITGNVTTLAPGASLLAQGSLSATGGSFAAGALAFPGKLPNPLGFKCELNLNGTWTDITQYVMLREAVTIDGMGRTDEQSSMGPSTLTMTLRNDGRFTPKNSGGAYYPNIVRNCQVRVSVNSVSATGVKFAGYRFYGEIASWPAGYNVNLRDTYMKITASGLWRRVSQSQVPIGSCVWRYIQLLSGAAGPAAYWGMEDGSGSTSFVLSDGTGTNLSAQGGTPSYAGDGTSFAGSNALPQLNGSRLAGNVTMSAPGSYCVRFALSVPAAGDSSTTTFTNGGQLLKILNGGTIATVIVNLTQDSHLNVSGQNAAGTVIFAATIPTKVNGMPVLVSYEQTGGAYALKIIKPGGTGVLDQVTNAGFSWTVGAVTQVQVSPQGRMADTTIGHLQVYGTTAVDIVATALNLAGRPGEQAATRFARLCTESNINYELTGSGGAALGPQTSDTMANVLQSIEDSDGGLLYESRTALALGYRTLASIMDQAPALTFAHNSGVLGEPLQPTYDDQLIRNQWTLTNSDGYVVTAQLNTGAMSLLPPPNGVGQGYAGSKNVSLSTHTLVNNLAQQLLDEGCCDEVRYPQVVINFQRAAAAAYFSSIPSMRIGDHFQITSMPAFLGGGTVKQLAWGYTEVMGGEVPQWQLTFNTIPELPFESSFSAGAATIAQGTGGAVAAGSAVGSSVTGAQIGLGVVGSGELANTVTARKVGGTTTLVSATVPYDWSFNFSGTPGDNTYFICTQDQLAQGMSIGDTFTTSVAYGGPFTVTSTDPPDVNGLVNVHFTPDATSPMSGGLVYGGKNGDLWINTSQGNMIEQWFNGAWTQYQFGPGAMSFNVGGTKVTFSVTAPTGAAVGDLWYNSGSGNLLSQWDGTAWQPYQYGAQAISAQSITAQHIVTGTVVAGIVNGTTVEGVYFIAGSGGGQNWMAATPGVPGFFMYLDTGAGNPQLIFSIAAGPGTDQWGNTWQGGATFVGVAQLLNVLSVEDTLGNTLSSIDYAGNITGVVINATSDLQLAGVSVTNLFNNAPQGLVTRGWISANSGTSWPATAIGTSDTAIQELDVTVPAGRKYELQVMPGTVVITTGPAANTQIIWRIFYTTDGSVPSTASTEASGHSIHIVPAFATTILNYPTPFISWVLPTPVTDTMYRVLVTGRIASGAFKFSNIQEMRFVDWGVDTGQWGNNGVVLGSGTAGGGGGLQTYNKTYNATESVTYYGQTAGNGRNPYYRRSNNSNMWTSCTYTPDRAFYEGDQYSFARFNYGQIATDIGSGTVNWAKLRLTNNASFYSSGSNVICGWTTYAGVFGDPFVPGGGTHMNQEVWTIGSGATLTHTLGSWWATSALTGGWTGFVFGTAFSYTGYTDQHNYGSLVGKDGSSSTIPQLQINYTK